MCVCVGGGGGGGSDLQGQGYGISNFLVTLKVTCPCMPMRYMSDDATRGNKGVYEARVHTVQ